MYYVIGGLGILTILILSFLVLAGFISLIALFFFWKTRRVLIPKLTLVALGLAEAPVKSLLNLVGFERESILSLIAQLRNRAYLNAYCKVPHEDRAVFVPQCLRHPDCPAPLTPEGIKCVSCGLCGIYRLREEVEKLEAKFFIAPGSSLIKRMIKKHKPKAVLGVGCVMEVKEGLEMVSSINLPVQGVMLRYDGCVDTRVDVINLLEKVKMTDPDYSIQEDEEYLKTAQEIADLWSSKKKEPLVSLVEERK